MSLCPECFCDMQKEVHTESCTHARVTSVAAGGCRSYFYGPPERTPPPLPNDAAARKQVPLATGLLDYFPDALCAVANLSYVANEQHNPGAPVHWDRSKSGDEADALLRHLVERGTLDTDGLRHSAKVAWRALALLQKEIEGESK